MCSALQYCLVTVDNVYCGYSWQGVCARSVTLSPSQTMLTAGLPQMLQLWPSCVFLLCCMHVCMLHASESQHQYHHIATCCSCFAVLAPLQGLRYLFQTESPYVLLVSGTGHAGMEAAIANILEPGETIVVGNSGIWGQRVMDLSERYGGEPCLKLHRA